MKTARAGWLMAIVCTILPAFAQPTIDPQTVTLEPGKTQQFTSNAKTAFWNIGGNGSIIARPGLPGNPPPGLYTAPAVLPASGIGATVRVTDLSTGKHADAFVTIAAPVVVPPVAPPVVIVATPYPGDMFVVSSSPTMDLVFARGTDATWSASAKVEKLAMVQIYRNGTRVSEKDIVSITATGGRLVLVTGVPWASADLVTGKMIAP